MTQRSPLFLDTTLGVARPLLSANGDTIDPAITGAVKFLTFILPTTTAGAVIPTCPSPFALNVTSVAQIVFKAAVASTAASAFTLKKNGTTVATITFPANGATATVTFASGAFTLAVGDLLTVTEPSVRDISLAGIGGYVTGV